MKDRALVAALKKEDKEALKSIYLGHKQAFINYAARYNLKSHQVLDIYQDAIVALRENALNGKLDDLNSELKTYLFSIGKYMIYKILKQEKKFYRIDDEGTFINLRQEYGISIDLIDELSEEQHQLKQAFRNLGEKCKTVLTLFYYRGFTLEDIAEKLNYNNKDVVKSQKSRCIKTLKDFIFNS